MWLVNEALKGEEDEDRISVKTVELWWFDWVQPWKCSSSVNTSIICCISFTTARTDWARGREWREKQKNDVTEVTQSAASERGNGKIRNCFRDKREGRKSDQRPSDVPPWRERLEETKDENSSLKMREERFPAELIALRVKGTVHPKKWELCHYLLTLESF